MTTTTYITSAAPTAPPGYRGVHRRPRRLSGSRVALAVLATFWATMGGIGLAFVTGVGR